jgi:hypothetical protein
MTWIGKILAILVMVMSLVWMWFSVSAFATRTNWKVQADIYKKAYEEAKTARGSEFNIYQSEKDALERQLTAAESRITGLNTQVAELQEANKGFIASANKLTQAINDGDVAAVEFQARMQAAIDEANKLRSQNQELQKDRVQLIIAKDQAEKAKQAAETLARQAEAEKLIAERQNERLVAQVADLRSSSTGSISPALSRTEQPAPVPEGLRGTLTAVRDEYVAINLGIDAGLSRGAVLDIYRNTNGGEYLGTIVIDSVYPKEAVAIFKPKDTRRSIKQLRPEERPKVGDQVGKVGSVGATP